MTAVAKFLNGADMTLPGMLLDTAGNDSYCAAKSGHIEVMASSDDRTAVRVRRRTPGARDQLVCLRDVGRSASSVRGLNDGYVPRCRCPGGRTRLGKHATPPAWVCVANRAGIASANSCVWSSAEPYLTPTVSGAAGGMPSPFGSSIAGDQGVHAVFGGIRVRMVRIGSDRAHRGRLEGREANPRLSIRRGSAWARRGRASCGCAGARRAGGSPSGRRWSRWV